MTEADILATTYDDKCMIYRPLKDTLPSGESAFKGGIEGRKVYDEEIDCALSSQSGGKVNQSNTTAKAPTEYCLFTRPEIDIQPKDYLVITHLGKTITALAGRPDRQLSHNNIPLKLDKEVV